MPVLFLDIDDVVCLTTSFGGLDAAEAINNRHYNPSAVFRKLFAPGPAGVLEHIHNTMDGRLRYVISSTWRELLGREELCEVFRKSGLSFVAAAMEVGARWCTPTLTGRSQRVDEIAAWLDRHHRGQAFAIVDDTYSGASLRGALTLSAHPFHGRVVLCQENVGLSLEHAQTLVDALERPATLPGSEVA